MMLRKVLSQLLISMLMIFTLTFSFVFIIAQTNKSRPEKRDKLYELNTVNDGLVHTIAYYLVKPILESALDRYIEKHGLKEYIKEIAQQERVENSTSFYEITEGSGSRVLCGQEVLLQMYKLSSNLAAPLPSSQVQSVTLRIGQDNWKEVGIGIMGMKEGGERVVTVNNSANDNKTHSYYVKLVEVKDKYPDSVNNMMIFNDLINRAGKKVRCGDWVSIKYSIMGHNGEYIMKDKAAQFKVGDKMVPLAIELGVVGMRAGNNRTIISPPKLLSVTDSMLIEDINFDGENIYIINMGLDIKP